MNSALVSASSSATAERQQRLSEQRARAGENAQRQDVAEQQLPAYG
jgi:hypothetical protein